MEQLFQLGSVGLAFDGVGVVILGFAFFAKSLPALIVESGTYWDGNNALLETLIQSQTDGIAGTSLLLVGFALQLLGAIGIRCDVAAQVLWFALIAALVIYVSILRKKIVSGRLERAIRLRHVEDKDAHA